MAGFDQSFLNHQVWAPIPTEAEKVVQLIDALSWEFQASENAIILDIISHIERINGCAYNIFKT